MCLENLTKIIANFATIFVSVAALVFTILSFWWQNNRLGKIVATSPQQYSSEFDAEKLIVRIPTVLFNTGARAIVVEMFRLRFLDIDREHLQWVGVCDDVLLGAISVRKAFAVKGRDTKEVVLMLQRYPFENIESGRPLSVQLEIFQSHKKKWEKLMKFSISVPVPNFRPERCVIDLFAGDETKI